MAIKIAASSTLDASAAGLTSLSVNSHTNTGVTSSSAPVTLTVQAEDSITASQFAEMVANTTSDLSNAFVARILNAVNEVVEDIVDTATSAPTIDLGWGKFVFEIAGSVENASDEPTADNYCYFSGQVATKYQRQFALMDAYVATGLNPCDLKRIVDVETSELNTIYGTKTFYAEGRGLTFGTASDKQEIYNCVDGVATTKLSDLTLTAAESYPTTLKLAIPSTAETPVGDYIIRIECSIDGKVYRLEKRVYVATAIVPTPELVKAKQGTRTDNNLAFGSAASYKIDISCTGLKDGFKSTDELRLDGCPTTATGTDWTANMSLASYVTASTDTTITLGNGFTNDSAKPDADWLDKNAQITLKRGDKTTTLLIKMVGS